jgi:hypothetical protein
MFSVIHYIQMSLSIDIGCYSDLYSNCIPINLSVLSRLLLTITLNIVFLFTMLLI